jgi:PTH1 family peptidyl-tRNA hydrolase
MHVVVGLGNPGLLYKRSRHNAGFQALDVLADYLHFNVTKRGFSGVYGEGLYRGERLVLVKPTTYMNLSGDCVQSILHFYKCPVETLIVLYDAIDLPGGAMRSIVASVNSENFPRVRIGVGNESKGDLKNYVLGKPGKGEQLELATVFHDAADAVRLILEGKLAEAQAQYNKKHVGSSPAARE